MSASDSFQRLSCQPCFNVGYEELGPLSRKIQLNILCSVSHLVCVWKGRKPGFHSGDSCAHGWVHIYIVNPKAPFKLKPFLKCGMCKHLCHYALFLPFSGSCEYRELLHI